LFSPHSQGKFEPIFELKKKRGVCLGLIALDHSVKDIERGKKKKRKIKSKG
jgi:hypothetical protein